MNIDDCFYNLNDESEGIHRDLAPRMKARIFVGDNSMLSIVTAEPYSEGQIHHHPEEQWGVLLQGDGVRIQSGKQFAVKAGDFWRTPKGIDHGFVAGPDGARILDIFSPPRDAYRKEASDD